MRCRSANERLLQAHERTPGPNLPAVGVPGELQIHAQAGGLVNGDGLMGQQHHRARGIAPGQGASDVLGGTVLGKARRSVVGNTRQVESLGPVPDGDALVAQHLQAHAIELVHPRSGAGARVVLVVSGHEEDPVTGAQAGHRYQCGTQLLDGAVHQIADDGDDIGCEIIGGANDALDEFASEQTTHVHVAHLDDARSV
jgi:hypothetical protein